MTTTSPIPPPNIDQLRPHPPKKTFWQKVRNYFLTGLVVAAPVSITIYLVWSFVNAVDNRVTPLIPERYNPETYLPFGVPGLGLLVMFIVLTALGALTANFFGRAIISASESLLDRTPVVRSIYSTLKQIFETVVSANSNSFRDVVLVEYPRKGLWAIAFVTSETKGEVQDRTEDDVVNVFLPTTPNPTSGFLLFAPKKDLIYLDMTVDDGMKYIISAGLVVPPRRPPRVTPSSPASPSAES
jgi:uncharacterized membrane protein